MSTTNLKLVVFSGAKGSRFLKSMPKSSFSVCLKVVASMPKSSFSKIIHNPSNTLFMRLSCPAALLPDSLIDNRLIVLILIFFYRLPPQDLILHDPQNLVLKFCCDVATGTLTPKKSLFCLKAFLGLLISLMGFST